MKSLSPKLYEAYKLDKNKMPNIPDLGSGYINVDDVLRAHYILFDYFTEKDDREMSCGVRSEHLLYSALMRQVTGYGNKLKYNTHIEIGATLFFGLIMDHPFHDGNKRTALLTLLYYLSKHSIYPKSEIKDFENLTVHIAAHTVHSSKAYYYAVDYPDNDEGVVQVIIKFLRKKTEKADKSYFIATYRELFHRFEEKGYEISYNEGKAIITKSEKTIFGKKRIIAMASAAFPGLTRQVDRKTLYKLFKELNIDNLYGPGKKQFITDGEPMFRLVSDYEGPLRRLRDK